MIKVMGLQKGRERKGDINKGDTQRKKKIMTKAQIKINSILVLDNHHWQKYTLIKYFHLYKTSSLSLVPTVD